MLESEFSREVIAYLESLGYYVVNVIVSNQAGCLDLLCCSPTGQFVGIELKVGSNKPSELQKLAVQKIRACKGLGFVAWTLQDVIKGLQGITTGDESEQGPKRFSL